MNKRIEIFRGPCCLQVRIAVEVSPQLTLGTGSLPTSFPLRARAQEVKARLQELNPDAHIFFLEEAPQPL